MSRDREELTISVTVDELRAFLRSVESLVDRHAQSQPVGDPGLDGQNPGFSLG
jgi:hypothetical protein